MKEDNRIHVLERKIEMLEENEKQSDVLRKVMGKCIMDLIFKPFVNRRKIRKMYKKNGFDISRTVQLYFKRD